ncbi:ATP-binding cassette domain-containing protein [Cohnella hongkongensis]|uniref:ATP-binding cassette domain-containing protein n=1 Tax=Cohnella hongkongensis TaxID=178337 RepID=A0ABV9F8C5_9BACL
MIGAGTRKPALIPKLLQDRAARINLSLIVISVLLMTVFGMNAPNFLGGSNFINMGHQMAITVLIGFAMTAVILAKGIDLSVGASMAFAGMVGGQLYAGGIPPLFCLLATLAVGALVGMLNGFLISYVKISPFIATFGTMALCRGASLILSNAESIPVNDSVMNALGSSTFLGIPVTIFLIAIGLVVSWTALNRTTFGRSVYAVGGNFEAAQSSAIDSKRIQFMTYVLAGLFAGLAAILMFGRVQSAQPLAGMGLEFDVIMAVVIGGTKLSGGVGGVVGTLFGAILVTLIRSGLSFFGTPQEVTYIVTGSMILISVLLYEAKVAKFWGKSSVRSGGAAADKAAGTSAQSKAAEGTRTLRLDGISKIYGSFRALDGVSFGLRSGEIVALVGENGAGKSTLVKTMSGVIQPSEGQLVLDGAPVQLKSPKHAREAGIGVIHQHYSLVLELTIAENLFLGREPRWFKFGTLQRGKMRKITKELLDEFQIPLNPNDKVADLTVGQRQLIEVLKATLGNPWLIIMDEPTSSLAKSEVEKLFKLIEQLKEKNVCILYISHKMEELYKLCARAVVLRDGKFIGDVMLADTTEEKIISMMVGRDIENIFPYVKADPKEVVLEVDNLGDGNLLKSATFHVRRGEIVVLAGLMGAGRSEVMNCIFGLSKIHNGTLTVKGRSVRRATPKRMTAMKIAFVPEDRLYSGFVPMMSNRHNLSLYWMHLKQKFGFIPMEQEKRMAADMIGKLNVRPADPDKATIQLSGGNQQKIVLGKWLAIEPDILLLDDPTRGVDVGAKSEIHQLIADMKAKGMAILMVSSELPEALNVADRIIVMHEGRTVAELAHGATETEVMNYALGMNTSKTGS